MASLRYEVVAFAVWGLFVVWKSGSLDRRREGLFFLPAILYSGLLVLLVWGAGYIARRHALAALLPLSAYAALGFGPCGGGAQKGWGTGPIRCAFSVD